MFTGIIEEIGVVQTSGAGKLIISAGKVLEDMALGDSIAVNGACLTVTGVNQDSFSVDVMPETLRRTNLGLLRAGSRVNLERALKAGGRLGGHLVLGHIDDAGKVASIVPGGNAVLFKCSASPQIMRYVVDKGFIAVDGVSLTVVEHDISSFKVSLVAYSRENTILSERKPSDLVNLEVDIIAKYVESLSRGERSSVTLDLLQERGFIS